MKIFSAILVALCFAGGALNAHADDVEPPRVHRQGGSTFMSGGAGEAQRKAMFRISNKYPIQLIFAAEGQQGDMSGVKVTLLDVAGNSMLEAVSEGPYFYINPPASGRYTFNIEYNGETRTMTKDLVGRRHLVLEFKFGENK